MALYAIGDLHLSLSSNKPMEIFGDGWRDYVARIREGFSVLTEDDVTVLCGDLSWGMSLEESLEDFRFIDALPGKKYLLKGNHDYWWNTAAKMERFFAENGLTTMMVTHNMKDAIAHGNRLIMMDACRVVLDIAGREKQRLTVPDLLALFSEAGGTDAADDKLLLA